MDFTAAFGVARNVFSYTNHTIMAEALETWTAPLMEAAAPGMFAIIEEDRRPTRRRTGGQGRVRHHSQAHGHRGQGGENEAETAPDKVHMARLAVYAGRYVNWRGPSPHGDFKERPFKGLVRHLARSGSKNKTNGITAPLAGPVQPQLAALLTTELLGSDRWLTDLSALKGWALRRHMMRPC